MFLTIWSHRLTGFCDTLAPPTGIADSKKLEHGCRMIYVGGPPFFGFGWQDGHVENVLAATVDGINRA